MTKNQFVLCYILNSQFSILNFVMHLLAMILFAAFVSAVFAGITGEVSKPAERFLYGLKVFAAFMGIGLGLAWITYFFF